MGALNPIELANVRNLYQVDGKIGGCPQLCVSHPACWQSRHVAGALFFRWASRRLCPRCDQRYKVESSPNPFSVRTSGPAFRPRVLTPGAGDMDVVMLSRLQFAITVMFHYIFPPLTIGMGVFLVYLEARYLKTRDIRY